MVINVTSFSRSGLSDWVIQRLSAVILAAYALWLLGAIALLPALDYPAWRGLFDATAMRVFSLLALAALCAHAWIGMWTVSTDYITARQFGRAATALRLLFQLACILLAVAYLVWGIRIFWGL